jgi:hypothetical protein
MVRGRDRAGRGNQQKKFLPTNHTFSAGNRTQTSCEPPPITFPQLLPHDHCWYWSVYYPSRASSHSFLECGWLSWMAGAGRRKLQSCMVYGLLICTQVEVMNALNRMHSHGHGLRISQSLQKRPICCQPKSTSPTRRRSRFVRGARREAQKGSSGDRVLRREDPPEQRQQAQRIGDFVEMDASAVVTTEGPLSAHSSDT